MMADNFKILKTVDDAILELSCYANGTTMKSVLDKKRNPTYNIQRCNRQFIDNLAKSTAHKSIYWTDKQAVWALKLIKRYKTQLIRAGHHNVDNLINNPKYANSFRAVDRTSTISVVDDKFIVKFPFNKEMVNAFKKLSRDNYNLMNYNGQDKIWTIELREDMLVFLMGWSALKGDAQFNEWSAQANLILLKDKVG